MIQRDCVSFILALVTNLNYPCLAHIAHLAPTTDFPQPVHFFSVCCLLRRRQRTKRRQITESIQTSWTRTSTDYLFIWGIATFNFNFKMSFKNKAGSGSGGGGGNGFKPLGLSDPVFQGVVRMGFRNPTPVQRKALPIVLSGADTCVMARTGSGKTVAFLIPLLETLLATPRSENQGVRGIVLSPTRELSLQTLRVLRKLANFTDIRSIGIHGGEGMEAQFDALSSKPDVIIATPGRLAHHLSEIPDFSLKDCQMCILDEADRLLEMGFAMQLRQISKTLPPDRCQKVLLSATMPKILVEFTKGGFTTDPQVVRLDQEASVSEDLRVSFITCRSLEKDAALLQILSVIQEDTEKHESTRTGLTLVFCATRHHVEYVATLLQASGQEATMIYGTLDSEARNVNLADFRNGRKPILVVTDVAARGIDVPFMDHVIHYHFPSTPKLFVHRSGRAARAGRIGYCWGLVEPDEMPYMVDLHLFLGRRLTSSKGLAEGKVDSDEPVSSYTLNDMNPEMVHYGSIPESILTLEVENVRRIMDAELAGSDQAEAMRALAKVSSNAMMQYRRTRPEPSREGIRRAKAILEGRKLETGQRVQGISIPPHPLLVGLEMAKYEKDKTEGKIKSLNDIENIRKRQEFLEAVSQFRPKETVFEAFATGGGRESGVLSQVDKGRTTVSSKKNDSSFALTAMKNMRRQVRLARHKGSALVVAGSANAIEQMGEQGLSNGDDGDDKGEVEAQSSFVEKIANPVSNAPIQGKRRLSKADRRRLKKDSGAPPAAPVNAENRKSSKKASGFRDLAFFIENDAVTDPEAAHRRRQVEAAMQPSAASNGKGSIGAAMRLEEAMMDIVGDEKDEMVQKQRMMRWDKSKRKYIQTTVGAELSGDSMSKRLKLESGQVVRNNKVKLGEIYEKWQKKTNRSIGRNGVFDNPTNNDAGEEEAPRGRRGGKQTKSAGSEKLKSAKAIRDEREQKEDQKLKNMNKLDRKRLQSGNTGKPKESNKKGSQGKRGSSGRWGVSKGGKPK
jgi:ATP-dependent RNA helicase DDX54/DBP10